MAAAGVADELQLDDSETIRALAALGRKLRDISGLPATSLDQHDRVPIWRHIETLREQRA